MAALPLDFLSQLDELQKQDLKAREVLSREREEVELLRSMVVIEEEKLSKAKIMEVEVAADAASSEKTALSTWNLAHAENKYFISLSVQLAEAKEQLAQLTSENDEERAMYTDLAEQLGRSRREVHTYFSAKPKWEIHTSMAEEEKELLGRVENRSVTQLEEAIIKLASDFNQVQVLAKEALDEIERNDSELQSLEEEAERATKASEAANNAASNLLVEEEAKVEQLCRSKNELEEEVQNVRAQIETLTKSLDQRKQHLLTQKKRLLDAMRPSQRK